MNCNKKDPIQARLFMLDAAVANATDYRPCLRHIYCDGKNIVATNGKILVYTNNDEQLAPGFYDLCTAGAGREKKTQFVPVTDEKAKDWHYPDWKKVVPNCTDGKTLEFYGGAEDRELEVFKLQFALASMGTGSLIGQEHIDLLCKPQLTYSVRIIDGRAPLIFELPNFYTMLVMPKWAANATNSVTKLLDAYVAERTKEAETAQAPEAESAGNSPEPVEMPEPAPEPAVAAPMPEPVEMPKTRTDTAAKPKTNRTRKPAFSYHCELKDGSMITLASIEAVRARADVVKCRIEPLKRAARKSA